MAEVRVRDSIVRIADVDHALLDPVSSLESAQRDFYLSDYVAREVEVHDRVLRHGVLENLNVDRLMLGNCSLVGIHVKRAVLNHAILHGCRISNTLFEDCQFIGAEFSEVVLEDAYFVRCRFNSASLGLRTKRDAAFIGTDLRDARFEAPNLERAVFDSCALEGVSFGAGRYKGLDLRGNTLAAIVGVANLKGVRLSVEQLPDFTALFIKDLEVRVEDI